MAVPGSGNYDTQKLKQIVKLTMYNCSHFHELSITPIGEVVSTSK